MRPAALAGISGGLTSALLHLITEPPVWNPSVPDYTCGSTVLDWETPKTWAVEPKSLVLGVLIGLALGPIIEVICVLRQYWLLQLRAAFRVPQNQTQTREPYRVLG